MNDAEVVKAQEKTKQVTIEHATRRMGITGGLIIVGLALGGAFAMLIVRGDHETFRLVLISAFGFLAGWGLRGSGH